MKDTDAINDVFVISTSGIPYYSCCFGGPECKNQPNHLLVSGFLAAVFQFSMQFGQKTIREIIFDDGQMAIDTQEIGKHQILTIFFASKNVKMKNLRKLVSKSADVFGNNYSYLLLKPGYTPKMSDFKSYSQKLNEFGIVKKEVMGEVPILNACGYSSSSDLKGHIYCKKQQKNIAYDEELEYRAMDKCPHLSS
ncbi:MAG: hypothetical protein ACW981_07670 [Candidatus Hodarchaeales archaeon]